MDAVMPWQTLIEVPTMRRFAGIDLISDRISDETMILSLLSPAGAARAGRTDLLLLFEKASPTQKTASMKPSKPTSARLA